MIEFWVSYEALHFTADCIRPKENKVACIYKRLEIFNTQSLRKGFLLMDYLMTERGRTLPLQ